MTLDGTSPLSNPPSLYPNITKFSVKGGTIRYPCPYCAEALTSPIVEAGGIDSCPSCLRQFMVPGEGARIAYDANVRERAEQKVREVEAKREVGQVRREHTKARTIEKAAMEAARQKKLHLDRDPLREWWLYMLIGTVLVLVTTGRHLIIAVTSDSTLLTALIFALFGIGLALNFAGVRRLRVEYVCAAACVEQLESPSGLKNLLSGLPAGVFHRHIQDLGQIARFDAGFSQDTLVTLLYSRLMARSKIVDILSSVLVTIGLIGTVLGLIIMTNGLNGALSSLDSENGSLLDGMRTTMSGLGTAFYTTLAGAILGSVALRILNNVYTSNVDHLVSYVASLSEVKIVPRLKQSARGQGTNKP